MRSETENILPIYGITPFTLLDFPGKTACIAWLSGCNMRCHYCHNPQIVRGHGSKRPEEFLTFLHKRRGLLDGVVLSGGEASLYPALFEFISRIRSLGYAVKLDTNGLRPDSVKGLLEKGLLDYLALDYKAPPEKFRKVTGIGGYERFAETLAVLCSQHKVPFEVRTTVHTSLIDEADIAWIISDLNRLKYHGIYCVQNFRSPAGRPTLGHLPPQDRVLDVLSLPVPKHFQLAFRNF